MATAQANNAQNLPLANIPATPPQVRLGVPRTPEAPKWDRHTERRDNNESSPTHCPRRSLFQSFLRHRDQAAHSKRALNALPDPHMLAASPFAHEHIGLSFRPKRLFVQGAKDASCLPLYNVDQGDDLTVDNSSGNMQRELTSGDELAEESERANHDEEDDIG